MTATTAEAAARGLYERLLQAWNERSAKDFAALFAADGTTIGFDGSQASGTQILDQLHPIFEDHPTGAYVAKVKDIRPLGSDSVLLRAVVGMIPAGQRGLKPELNAVQTLVARRTDDDWRIVLFQNTPAQYHGRPDLAEQHTAELRPLQSGDTIVD